MKAPAVPNSKRIIILNLVPIIPAHAPAIKYKVPISLWLQDHSHLFPFDMLKIVRHPFHLVDESPWPLIRRLGAFYITCGFVKIFYFSNYLLFFVGAMTILLVITQWWINVSQEGRIQGLHTFIVQLGLRWGIILFIVSEIMFFVSFFWAFFHRRLAPNIEIGRIWPPFSLIVFNPFQVPLLNTIVLLSSGIRVTWAHHALIEGDHSNTCKGLFVTIILGAYFTLLQGLEYYEARFRMADRIYGSTFFLATGFHGFHVLVGTTFLVICYIRISKFKLSVKHHFGFEAAAWYWHFVDVVWLFLYVRIYWWGGA